MSDEKNIESSAPEKEPVDEVDSLSVGTDERNEGDEIVEETEKVQEDESDDDDEEQDKNEPEDEPADNDSEDQAEEVREAGEASAKNKKQNNTTKKEKIVKILKWTTIISLPLTIAAVLFFLKPAFITNFFNNPELELDTSGTAAGKWTPEELEMIHTAKETLKETEKTWDTIFTEKRGVYKSPKFTFFTDTISSVCENINNENEETEKKIGQSFTGTFYCPEEKRIYVDLSLQRDLKNRLDIPEKFTQGYVIAHEVGHHIQNLAGISEQLPAARLQLGDKEFAKILERMELQADCFAGIWAQQTAQKTYNTSPKEFADALNAVSHYSRKYLKEKTVPDTMPDAFSYSSLRLRLRWFTIGYDKGSFDACDTFIVTQL